MSIKISTISLGAYGITTVIPQPPTKCSIHSGYCHTCIYLHFYELQHLDFLQIRVFKGVRSIYPLHVPHWDFNKGCNFAQIINDCLLIHLSRIFDPWQFTTYGSSWMQTFFSLRKVNLCDKSHIFQGKMWLYNPCTQKCQIQHLAKLYL